MIEVSAEDAGGVYVQWLHEGKRREHGPVSQAHALRALETVAADGVAP